MLLQGIDHVAQSVGPEEILSWRLFYRSLLAVEPASQVEVLDPALCDELPRYCEEEEVVPEPEETSGG